MARTKKRSDIYNQPGLFDAIYQENAALNAGLSRREMYDRSAKDKEDTPEETIDPFPQDFLVTDNPDRQPPLRYISFGSGSSGNSAYLGTDKFGILIDAGVDGKTVEKTLRSQGIDMFKVVGIILTHDHHDHSGYIYNILRYHRHITLYCTPKAMAGLQRHGISRRVRDHHHPIYKEIPFNIKDFRITAFDVSHDGTDNAGYMIETGKHRFVVATDMGFIGERAFEYMKQATALMMESDYDTDMLRTGRYPEYLKARILSNRGHLSNKQVADFLLTNWTPTLRHIFLCHLSRDNNSPAKALQEAREALLQAGAPKVGNGSEDIENRDAPVQLYALPRFDASPMFFIR